MEATNHRPQLDVLLLCGHPHASLMWGPLYHTLEDIKKKSKSIARVGESYDVPDAMRELSSGKVNTIFLAPLEFHLGSPENLAGQAGLAASFIQKIRTQFPEVVFVLAFSREETQKQFLASTNGRFDHYLTVLTGSAEQTIPGIIEKCELWHERRAEKTRRSGKQAFLCHASGDKKAVRDLGQRLREDGFVPWIDEEQLLPGQDWQQEIPKAVRECDAVIVCLSRSSINKEGFVQKEIRYALDVADEKPDGKIFIIPLKLEDCGVPDRLRRWQWVNLFEDNGYEKLVNALRKIKT